MTHNFYQFCKEKFISDKVFLRDVARHHEFTYADLDQLSRNIAVWLRNQGHQTGDRVMVQVEKSPQNLIWYFATLRAGLTYIPLNTAYQPDELSYFIGNAKPSIIICDPAKLILFQELASCQIETLSPEGDFSQTIPTAETVNDVEIDADSIAVILYTSGTTGKPKGAMITHANLISNATALSETWAWQTDDVMLHALPIFHIHGLFVASHLAVMNASTIIFLDKFSPQSVVDELPKATVYMGVPTNYTRLLQHEGFNSETCKNMRLFTSGSAPLLTQTFAQMQSQTGFEIVERYGMTETGMNTSNPLDGKRKPGTVGLPLPGVEAIIVDDAGDRVRENEPGNLLVRGSNVFKGYWEMPDKTAEDFTEDGFFHTGDVASIDADGYVSIVGRNKDMVITGGLNVYPKEIEALIDKIEGVQESAVIGVPDADFGETVTAVVVRSNDQLTNEQISSELNKLASFKRPKQIHFVAELPRNTMGKVQKNLLREQFSLMAKEPTRVAVLASHRGSNFQAILDAIDAGDLNARVVLAISNNSNSEALERARRAKIATLHLSGKIHPDSSDLDIAMANALTDAGAELVVTAGYMKKLGAITLQRFKGKVINIHPSLLPKYGGHGMYGMRVHEAVIQNRETESGLTVHLVDGEYDAGPIISQRIVPVHPSDTPERLAQRIISEEHNLLVETLQKLTK